MTFRESDDPVVPMKLTDQLSRWKSSNIDVGKAVRISRDSDQAPSVLSDAATVIIRLDRSHTFAMGVLERMPSFPPRVNRRVAQRRLGVPGLFVEVR